MLDQLTPTKKLDTRVQPCVRIINGQLDEDPSSPHAIVMHGRIDPATLRFLKVDDDYQRPLGNRPDIWEALKEGTVLPAIELGVRGLDYRCDGDDFVISDPVYIIDGWQRVGTAMSLLDSLPQTPIRIFATIHFGTDDKWERHRFTDLNKNIKKVSPNLHLRNMRDSNDAILTLYGLSHNDRTFPLFERVQWSQNMLRGELISALVLGKVAMTLHAHATAIHSSSTQGIAAANARAAQTVSLNCYRRNVSTFFKIVDECWGIRNIEFRHGAPQIKVSFLICLARLFSSHVDFWDTDGRQFSVPADIRSKLRSFSVRDPQIASLAGSGGTATKLLFQMMVNHVNSGKRTRHLQPRRKS